MDINDPNIIKDAGEVINLELDTDQYETIQKAAAKCNTTTENFVLYASIIAAIRVICPEIFRN